MTSDQLALAVQATYTTDYVLCGWRVRSEVLLPELVKWRGENRAPDIAIRWGLAPTLPDPAFKAKVVQVGRDGACRIATDDGYRFLVTGGNQVIIEPFDAGPTPQFRAWLFGPVLGILCHQRGLLPLHAVCIRVRDRAVLLCGPSGGGKSTLAAALVKGGHMVIADDFCAIEPDSPTGPLVWPSFARLKLRADSLEALGISAEGLSSEGLVNQKFHHLDPKNFDPAPVRLGGIYCLVRGADAEDGILRLDSDRDAIVALSAEIYRRPIGFHLGHKRRLLNAVSQVTSATSVCRLVLRSDLSCLD